MITEAQRLYNRAYYLRRKRTKRRRLHASLANVGMDFVAWKLAGGKIKQEERASRASQLRRQQELKAARTARYHSLM